MNRIVLMGLTVAAALATLSFAAACGDDDDDDATRVDAELKEWTISPSVASVNAGKVRFVGKNTGTTAHELVVMKTDTAADKLPVKDGLVEEEGAGTVIGEIEEFDAGKSESVTLDLPAGKYVLFCNVLLHYGQGMHVAFEVK